MKSKQGDLSRAKSGDRTNQKPKLSGNKKEINPNKQIVKKNKLDTDVLGMEKIG